MNSNLTQNYAAPPNKKVYTIFKQEMIAFFTDDARPCTEKELVVFKDPLFTQKHLFNLAAPRVWHNLFKAWHNIDQDDRYQLFGTGQNYDYIHNQVVALLKKETYRIPSKDRMKSPDPGHLLNVMFICNDIDIEDDKYKIHPEVLRIVIEAMNLHAVHLAASRTGDWDDS